MARPPEKLGKLVIGQPQARQAAVAVSEPVAGFGVGFWLACLAVALVVAASILGWQTGWLPAQFHPRKVVLTGQELSTSGEVLAVLEASQGGSYLEWWRAARSIKPGGSRWLTGVSVKPLTGRSLLLKVAERKPVLRVESAGAGYWLCDDGSVEKARLEDHKQPLFTAIKQSPVLRLNGVGIANISAHSDNILLAAALANEVMQGQIKILELNAKGELSMIDKGGLEIRFGQPRDLPAKIAILPSLLRSVSAERGTLAYLDGSGPLRGTRFVYMRVRK